MNATNSTYLLRFIDVSNFLLGVAVVFLNLALIVALLKARSLSIPGFRLLLVNLSIAFIIMSISLCVSEGTRLILERQDFPRIKLFYCHLYGAPISTATGSIGYWFLGMAIDRIWAIKTYKNQESEPWILHGKVSKTLDTFKS